MGNWNFDGLGEHALRLRSQLRHLTYLVRQRPYALEKPLVLQFPVIDICNSQCQMCLIWENKKSPDISSEQLRTGLKNPLFSEVLAVGLNGGEPTLRKDLGEIANVLFEELPKLQTISLITNAYKYLEVIERISDVGKVVQKHHGLLDLMVSLDGVGHVHDQVRGKPGNFARAQNVLDFAQQSDLVHNLRIGCTIIRENVYGLHDLFDFAVARGIYIKFRLGIPHQRLYTQDLKIPYALTDPEKYHVAEFLEGLIRHYEPSRLQRFFYRSLIDQLIDGAPRRAGCDWQHRGATITSRGELMYCAVQSKPLGTIYREDSARQYFSNKPHLDKILQKKCDSCHHDYMGLPPKSEQLKLLADHALSVVRGRNIIDVLTRSRRLNALVGRHRFRARVVQLQRNDPVTAAMDSAFVRSLGTRVLICGWYGTETLGDKAILGGIIHSMKRALPSVKFTLVSLHPYVSNETKRQLPELAEVDVVSVAEAMRIAGLVDFTVFGGGPLMAIDQLADMRAIITRSHAARVPIIVAGCGLGPVGMTPHNRAITDILNMAAVRIYRDEASRDLAKRLGIDIKNDKVAEDPAFTWLSILRKELSATYAPQPRTLLLGLREFPWQEYARDVPHREAKRIGLAYEHAIVTALQEIAGQNVDLVIRPLPMCTNHFGGDDRWFYRRLFRSNSALLPRLDTSLLNAELSPRDYCVAFLQAHACISMRYHSLVFALALGIPTVAIDYTRGQGKVASLAAQFGVAARSIDRLDHSFLVSNVRRLLTAERSRQRAEPRFADMLVAQLARMSRDESDLAREEFRRFS